MNSRRSCSLPPSSLSSSSPPETFFAPCPRGLEALLAGELKSLGAGALRATAGGVGFSGSWEVCYRANLWSRLASRVLWRVAGFEYASEDDIYAAARAVNWFDLFDVNREATDHSADGRTRHVFLVLALLRGTARVHRYSRRLRSIHAVFSCTCMRWVSRSHVG